ncbi:MAG: thioredoxin family protein [Actinobacteria bacterium]|nr:thioredoxin family protein [Actinomycetota bacterium]
MAIAVGSPAPPVRGVPAGPHALVFYKVTCPTCQMAAPALDRFERAYPGRIAAVGQDPAGELAEFAAAYAMSISAIPDQPPYPISDAYGIATVPTVVVVGVDGTVADVVEAWDRQGVNRASAVLAGLLGTDPAAISEPGDGLPEFRPG